MRYSSIIYSCYAVGVVAALTDVEDDQVNANLLIARHAADDSLPMIYPRSPVNQASPRGGGQTRGSNHGGTQTRGRGRPQINENRESTPQSRGSPQPKEKSESPKRSPSRSPSPSRETPEPQDKLHTPGAQPSRGRSQSRGTPFSRGTPESSKSEATYDNSVKSQTPSAQAGRQGQGYGRGQGYASRNRLVVHLPSNSGFPQHQYPAHQPMHQFHHEYPYNPHYLPSTGPHGQIVVPVSQMQQVPVWTPAKTSVETFAAGPGKYYAHGGDRPWNANYLGPAERGSKSAEHETVSFGGGETTHGGRMVTRLRGQKVQSRVTPGPGGTAHMRYLTDTGVADTTFAHPSKGQIRLASQNGVPVTLQTEAEGPVEISSMARNSPPRNYLEG